MFSKMEDNQEEELQNLKMQLMNQINLISGESESIWDQILAEQQLCTKIISEQVIANGKFSDYHDLWTERSISWPEEFLTHYRFNELDQEVTALGNWLHNFESKSQAAMNTIREMIEDFNENTTYIDEMREFVLHSTDMLELENINLNTFHWVNPEFFTNTQELDQEWNDKNLYQNINACVLEMTQLFNSPADILAEMEHLSEGSSSSSNSRESNEGISHYH